MLPTFSSDKCVQSTSPRQKATVAAKRNGIHLVALENILYNKQLTTYEIDIWIDIWTHGERVKDSEKDIIFK